MMNDILKIQPELNLENNPETYLSFSDAAEKILKESAENQPMHFREITQTALEKKYLNSRGMTPAQTMRVVLTREIARNNARGRRPRFYAQPKGFFGLTAWLTQENDFFKKIDQHNQEIKNRYLKKLRELKPQDFEIFIGELMAKLQFEDVIVTGRSNDGGIDITGVLNAAGTIKTKIAIQVKRWQNNVQKAEIQKLRGALGAHEQGMFITTSGFSKGAISEAERSDAAPIALMQGTQLVEILVENEIGIKKNLLDWIELDPQEAGQEIN